MNSPSATVANASLPSLTSARARLPSRPVAANRVPAAARPILGARPAASQPLWAAGSHGRCPGEGAHPWGTSRGTGGDRARRGCGTGRRRGPGAPAALPPPRGRWRPSSARPAAAGAREPRRRLRAAEAAAERPEAARGESGRRLRGFGVSRPRAAVIVSHDACRVEGRWHARPGGLHFRYPQL